MAKETGFEDIPIGMEIGPAEMVLDEAYLEKRLADVQWQTEACYKSDGVVPPGVTVNQHAGIKFQALPDMKVSIWAKSEHEFIQPVPVGTKVMIRGKVVEKYVKRNRNYLVTECETRDATTGTVFMKSRETSVYVE